MHDDVRGLAPPFALNGLCDPDLGPLFWTPERRGLASAWWGHVPFAQWLVCAIRPQLLVELGTHYGVSYAGFCNAVVRGDLATRCFAVDNWEGDPHAGVFDESVYENVREFHDARYAEFSTLLRCTFDAAVDHFADRSIDLLHIDGYHTYEAVRHDFETWLPKLSDRAVVLFHDTAIHRDDFAVWRLWQELSAQYPHFEFQHSCGLGVLAVGKDVPAAVAQLCAFGRTAAAVQFRNRVAHIGERWVADLRESDLRQNIDRQRAEFEGRLAAVEEARAEAEQHAGRLEEELTELESEIALRDQRMAELERSGAHRDQQIAAMERERQAWIRREAEAAIERRQLVEAEAELARQQQAFEAELAHWRLEGERHAGVLERAKVSQRDAETALSEMRARYAALTESTLWRATSPLRHLGAKMPPGARRALRGAAKLLWWSVRLELVRKLRERQRLLNPLQWQSGQFAGLLFAGRPYALSDHPRWFEFEPLLREFFDAEWYRSQCWDFDASGVDVYTHFVADGARELRDPSPDFDTAFYLRNNPDIVLPKEHPVAHYLLTGRSEGRSPKIYNVREFGIPVDYASAAHPVRKKLCILLHLYNTSLFSELATYIENIEDDHDLYINLVDNTWTEAIYQEIRERFPSARILISPDHGRDIGGFTRLMSEIDFHDYDLFLLVHSKTSPHFPEAVGGGWRRGLLDAVVGSPDIARSCIAGMRANPMIGITAAAKWRSTSIMTNSHKYQELLNLAAVSPQARECEFVAGTMFFARTEILKRLYHTLTQITFEDGHGKDLQFHTDGQYAHAVERLMGNLVKDEGLFFWWV